MERAAIIIDLYENESEESEWAHEIISMINKQLDVDTVILSTYAIGHAEMFSDNSFYRNAFENLEDNFKTSKIKISQISKFSKNKKTSSTILDTSLYRDDLKLTAHHYPYEFDYRKLKSVFFFGKAWDQCLRTRPLGINFWAEHTEAVKCFLPRSCRYSNDSFVNFNRIDGLQFNEESNCYILGKIL